MLSVSLAIMAHPAPGSAAAPQRLHRLLDGVPSPVPYPWVVGTDWPRRTRVAVTARYRGAVRQTTLRTGSDGSFGVGIQGVSWCKGLVVEALDATKYRVVLHGTNPFRKCPVAMERRDIVFHSLNERELHAHQYVVDSRRVTRSYTIHVGDMVYVYVRLGHLSLQALDRQHFRLIEHGTTPVCPPNADCAFPPGVYYRVLALHAGHALLPVGHASSVRIRVIA